MPQLRLPFHDTWPQSWPGDTQVPAAPLPARRQQVLALYLTGKPRKDIARRLGVSPHTIRNHIRIVYDDHGFSNRIQALRWALEQPNLAKEVLDLSAEDDKPGAATPTTAADMESLSVEQAIKEAIEFFQRQVIESPMEEQR